MLESANLSLLTISVMLNVALIAGSSQHGKARCASIDCATKEERRCKQSFYSVLCAGELSVIYFYPCFKHENVTHLKLSYCEVNIFPLGVLALAPIQAAELVAEHPMKLAAEHGIA